MRKFFAVSAFPNDEKILEELEMKISPQKPMQKLFLLGMIGLAPLCRAGMMGDVVDLTAQFPDIGPSDVLLDPGPKTIDGTVEWPEGTFAGVYSNYLSVQITDTQIILSFNELYGAFQPGTFNGLEIAFLTGTIANASPDPASGFDPGAITIDGNDLFLNYEGVTTSYGELGIIDVTSGASMSGVPEPGTIPIVGVSLAALCLLRRPDSPLRKLLR